MRRIDQRKAKREKEKNLLDDKLIAIASMISLIQIIMSIIFYSALMQLNIFPDGYMYTIVCILIILFTLFMISQKIINKGRRIGQVISVLLSLALVIASSYTMKANTVLAEINSTSEIKIENMIVAISSSDAAESIDEVMEYTFAIQATDGVQEEYVTAVIEEIEAETCCTFNIIEYENLSEQIEAFENAEVDGILYNEAYMDIVEEVEPEFIETIKEVFEYGVEVALEAEETEEAEAIEIDMEESTFYTYDREVFSVYISGIDVYGDISTTSRSDVNIIAVVNQETEQILLVTTPRDYYVTLPGVSSSSKDKLTHAAIYGVDVSIGALEELYDMDIDYYAKVNFTSFVDIIDALGGVEVYSQQTFSTTERNGIIVDIEEGYNELTGSEALLFARERYNLENGDYQRGENQEELIKAMIEKITSPSLITSAFDILESVIDNVDTDMSLEKIQEMIKIQISEDIDWDIIMMSAEGTDGSAMCYSYSGGTLSVVYPDEDSVVEISEAIDAIYNNEIIEIEE